VSLAVEGGLVVSVPASTVVDTPDAVSGASDVAGAVVDEPPEQDAAMTAATIAIIPILAVRDVVGIAILGCSDSLAVMIFVAETVAIVRHTDASTL